MWVKSYTIISVASLTVRLRGPPKCVEPQPVQICLPMVAGNPALTAGSKYDGGAPHFFLVPHFRRRLRHDRHVLPNPKLLWRKLKMLPGEENSWPRYSTRIMQNQNKRVSDNFGPRKPLVIQISFQQKRATSIFVARAHLILLLR